MNQHAANSAGEPLFDEARLFSLMEGQKADALLVSTRHNTGYLTGGYFYPLYVWDSHTRRTQHLSFLTIVPDSLEKAFFVGRPGECDVLKEAEIWTRDCTESPAIGSLSTVATMADQLRRRGLDKGRLVAELSSLSAEAFVALQRELPHAEFFDASSILDPLRAVKSPGEIEIMRDGASRTLAAIAAALAAGSAGESTEEVCRRLQGEFLDRDLHFLYALICAGPHLFRAPSPKRIWESGRPLHIDTGALYRGYIVEVCRMGHLGIPSALSEDLFGACRDLRDEMLKAFCPGVPVCEVQKRANKYLETTRFGDIGKFIAHGIGRVHHEDPAVNLKSSQPLEAGMVISIEMEYMHPEAGHIKIEELIVVTEGGGELITPGGDTWTIAH